MKWEMGVHFLGQDDGGGRSKKAGGRSSDSGGNRQGRYGQTAIVGKSQTSRQKKLK